MTGVQTCALPIFVLSVALVVVYVAYRSAVDPTRRPWIGRRARVAVLGAVPLLLVLLAGTGGPALGDEGLWTFDHFPAATVAERHGVRIDQSWLDRVRLATVRLAGCTASFVSAEGLLLTNHHCVESCLAQNSTRDEKIGRAHV